MIRTFTLRDIPLVHRLSEQGLVFHTESALTRAVHPLREALVNMILGGQFPTYIWKEDGGEAVGVAQLRQDEDESHAHIIFLGLQNSQPNVPDEVLWLPFLEQLIAEAGQQGIHSLIAEVSEEGEELPVLRKAGFAVYTRQDIWALHQFEAKEQYRVPDLEPAAAVDQWDIHLLYANIVPRLIQLVEPIPPDYEQIWVLHVADELAAFVHFNDGPAGSWLRLFIRPNAQQLTEQVVVAALRHHPPRPEHPVYCVVRRYQSWMQAPLERLGFTHNGSQALMVRHTVNHTRKLVSSVESGLQTNTAPAQRNWFSVQTKKRIHQLRRKNKKISARES